MSLSPLHATQSSTSTTKQSDTPANPPAADQYLAEPQHPIDRTLERLNNEILSTAPYLLQLKVRSSQFKVEVPFWRKDTHFSENEEELQYLTFRQNFDGTLIHTHGQWDDGDGGLASKGDRSSQTSSGRTPLAGQGKKKKISLEDYKNKRRGSDTKPMATKGPAETNIPDANEGPRKDDEKDDKKDEKKGESSRLNRESSEALQMAESNDFVRKQSGKPTTGLQEPSTKSDINIESQQTSKAKTSSQSVTHSSDKTKPIATERKFASSTAITTSGPALSNPIVEITGPHGLPKMISPTLPDDIEQALARLPPTDLEGYISANSQISGVSPSVRSTKHKGHVSSSSQAKSTSSTTGAPLTPKPRQDPKAITSAPRQRKEGTSYQVSKHSSSQIEDHSSYNDPEASEGESLIVTLKVKKKFNRSILSQYLKLKSTPKQSAKPGAVASRDASLNTPSLKKPLQESESSGSDEPLRTRKSGARSASQKDDNDVLEPGPKRHKSSSQIQSHKQQKNPSQSHPPQKQKLHSTQHTSALHEGKASHPTASQKSHLSAPLGGVMSNAMQRTGSQESAATPVQPSRDATPTVPTSNGHRPESPSRRKLVYEFKKETSRLVTLASNIKHDSDAYLKHLEHPSDDERKLGCIVATEAVLCFVLAAVVSDEPYRISNTLANTELWRSTRVFVTQLASNHGRRFRQLYGLLCQLEGVMCDTLEYHTDLRLEAILREYQKMKTREIEDSDSGQAANYVNEQYHALAKASSENRQRARTAWREGQAALFISHLEQQFPKTWQGRRDFPGRGKGHDRVQPHEYAKEGFSLPLGTNTTGLEAVNFGLALLSELAKDSGLDWKPKLVL